MMTFKQPGMHYELVMILTCTYVIFKLDSPPPPPHKIQPEYGYID